MMAPGRPLRAVWMLLTRVAGVALHEMLAVTAPLRPAVGLAVTPPVKVLLPVSSIARTFALVRLPGPLTVPEMVKLKPDETPTVLLAPLRITGPARVMLPPAPAFVAAPPATV